jgi:hypothetical protein
MALWCKSKRLTMSGLYWGGGGAPRRVPKFISIVSCFVEWKRSGLMYLLYRFVVSGCLDIVVGGVGVFGTDIVVWILLWGWCVWLFGYCMWRGGETCVNML